jgi:hypothetical protein
MPFQARSGRETIFSVRRNRPESGPVIHSHPASIGGMKMITLKLIALGMAAGMVFTFASEDFGTNLLLAIVTCLS